MILAGYPHALEQGCVAVSLQESACSSTVAQAAQCTLKADAPRLDVYSGAVVNGANFRVAELTLKGNRITIRNMVVDKFTADVITDSQDTRLYNLLVCSSLVFSGTQNNPIDLGQSTVFSNIKPCSPNILYAGVVGLGSFKGIVLAQDETTIVRLGDWGESGGRIVNNDKSAVIIDMNNLTRYFGGYERDFVRGDAALQQELVQEAAIVGAISLLGVASLFLAHGHELFYLIKKEKKKNTPEEYGN